MKKIIVIAVVLILGGLWYANGKPSLVSRFLAPPAPQAKTFSEYMSDGGSYACTVASFGGQPVTGTVYLDHGRVRANIVSAVSGSRIESHVIVKDRTGYVWNSLATIGYKKSVPADISAGFDGWDPKTVGGYQCQPWSRDETEFALPSNVTFQAAVQ